MERYRSIIDEWKAFKQESRRHPINVARENKLKSSEGFEENLRENFENVEKATWNDRIYRLKETESPGKSPLHWRGEYYVQEESAALPVAALNPQPGEKILDMCAAPGGKTTQIADKIDNKGLVVANDDSAQRMKSLHANIYRTGAACVTATNKDGRAIPESEKYDRVLVDAPCSGEGDRFYRSFEPASKEEIKGLQELQKQLVDKARKLLKSGGTLVYSTCTINPWENEAVAEHLLDKGMRIEEIDQQLESSKGLIEFEERKFDERLKKAVRIYPHHLSSGVIFVAKFRKSE